MNIPDDELEIVVSLTITAARLLECDNDELASAIDEAQGPVFLGDRKRSYVVIEIVPDPEAA